jgi:hypothetical protein
MVLINRLALFIAVFLFICSCKSAPKNTGDDNRFKNSMITMEKTACYGTCPVYSIIIYGNGKTVYEGKEHVKKTGKYEKQLSPQEISKLFNAFECANFFDFRSEYTEEVTDLPTTYLTFEHRGFKKKITDYYGAPEELKKLEKLVEAIVESESGWKEIE